MIIRYSVVGNVDSTENPIVFLHGLFGSPDNWKPIVNQLTDTHKCILIELPLDFSSVDINFDGIHTLTDYTKKILDGFGDLFQEFVMCGNSLGGQVAIDYTLKYPNEVETLIISGSAGLSERSLSDGNHPKMNKETIRRLAEEIFYNKEYCTNEMVDEVFNMLNTRKALRFLLKVAKATRNTNFNDDLHKIKIPTLLIWGKQDVITPPSVAEEFDEKIKHSKLVYIDKCGHAAQIEQPDEFTLIMKEFLKDNG
jgi:pimeloyl-ACP methyl ester carboxylesterase